MIRWDNLMAVIVALLVILTIHQALTVYTTHRDTLQAWYEHTFTPEQRPILILELLVLGLVITVRLWHSAHRNVRRHENRRRDP